MIFFWAKAARKARLVLALFLVASIPVQANSQGGSDSAHVDFFPVNVLDTGIADTFTNFLTALDETSLFAVKDSQATSYRLIWFRPGLMPVAVRIAVQKNGLGDLEAKVVSQHAKVINKKKLILDKNTGLAIDRTALIPADKVGILLELVQQSDFWSLGPEEPDSALLDGPMCVLEGIRDGKYHVVYRYSPKASNFTHVAKYLAKDLAQLDDSIISIP